MTTERCAAMSRRGSARRGPARKPQQQVRVRADAAPDVGLVAQRHAWQVADEVGEELQVQVRLPAAVDLRRPEPRDLLARADLAGGQRFGIEVPVERPEGAFVAQDEQAAVVAGPVAVLPPLDDAVERREDRRPGGGEDVDRHVPRAPAPVRRLELGRGVDRALLVVAADREAVDRRHRRAEIEHRRVRQIALDHGRAARGREELAESGERAGWPRSRTRRGSGSGPGPRPRPRAARAPP